MVIDVLKFVRMPILMLVLYTTIRFLLGVNGVPYAPRGNAMASVVGVTILSCLYFGALSKREVKFGWGSTLLIGVIISLTAQILIFTATLISYSANLNTYFVHWDALNVPEGTVVPMAQGMKARALGVLTAPISGVVMASIGRLLGFLAPEFKKN